MDASLADRAYEQLRRHIIRCELEPGQHITEGMLVAQTGIGKTPIREALGRLVQQGLVRNLPRHGYQVEQITLGDVRELFGVRLIVEPSAVQLAAGHVDVARLRRLDELCQAGYRSGQLETVDSFLAANHEFHAMVAAAAGNKRLADIVTRLLDESDRFFYMALMLRNRSEEMAHEHRELVDALVAGDGEHARRIALDQIVAAERMVLDAILSSPSVGAAQVVPPPRSLFRVVEPAPERTRAGRR